MRQRLIRFVSGLMFAIFLAGVMPKEYIHELLFDHHDDIHPVYGKNEIVFTSEHNHCSFMGFVFAPFVATEYQVFTFRVTVTHAGVYHAVHYCYLYEAPASTQLLRGPPVLA